VADTTSQTLAGIALFSDLDADELDVLDRSCRWRRYSPHEQIIDRQSETRDVFLVVAGTVRVVNYSLSGREVTFDDLPEGSHFGELAAIDGQPRSASVMALNDCLIASMPPEQFLRTLEKHPPVALKVMIHLARVVRKTTERIMDLSTLGANNRVHAELLRLARVVAGADGNRATIKPIPMHGDIASRVSTTRETVARVLNDLARQGMVERRKDSMVIPDIGRLEDMVEEVRGAI
jgi:CRP-like cAMP-binding protein